MCRFLVFLVLASHVIFAKPVFQNANALSLDEESNSGLPADLSDTTDSLISSDVFDNPGNTGCNSNAVPSDAIGENVDNDPSLRPRNLPQWCPATGFKVSPGIETPKIPKTEPPVSPKQQQGIPSGVGPRTGDSNRKCKNPNRATLLTCGGVEVWVMGELALVMNCVLGVRTEIGQRLPWKYTKYVAEYCCSVFEDLWPGYVGTRCDPNLNNIFFMRWSPGEVRKFWEDPYGTILPPPHG